MPANHPIVQAWPRLMNIDNVCAYTSLSETAIKTKVEQGDFPAPQQISTNRKAWLLEDIDGWIDRISGKASTPQDALLTDWEV